MVEVIWFDLFVDEASKENSLNMPGRSPWAQQYRPHPSEEKLAGAKPETRTGKPKKPQKPKTMVVQPPRAWEPS